MVYIHTLDCGKFWLWFPQILYSEEEKMTPTEIAAALRQVQEALSYYATKPNVIPQGTQALGSFRDRGVAEQALSQLPAIIAAVEGMGTFRVIEVMCKCGRRTKVTHDTAAVEGLTPASLDSPDMLDEVAASVQLALSVSAYSPAEVLFPDKKIIDRIARSAISAIKRKMGDVK